MRLIIEIRFGPRQGKKAILAPGQALRVGRAPDADLAVRSDPQMSTAHCEMTWDGEKARVRDLGSAKGTWLNGERVNDASVAHGDWLRVGDTALMIYVEEHTPPRRGADVAMTAPKARALAALESATSPLFAVLDAARGERVLELARESVETYRSLYEGVKAESLAEVAPYLVELPRGSRLLPRLVREGWGKRWGIFFTCRRPFKEVRAQLRRFLRVESEEGHEPLYFRYYDPATLRVFLAGCPLRQKIEFFGEIECFWAEERDGAATLHLAPVANGTEAPC